MSPRPFAALLAAAAVLGAAGCTGMSVGGAGGSGAVAGPLKVALVDALTGPLAAVGIAAQNGLQVEIDQLNAGGGLLGQRVQLVSADDGGQPDRVAAVVRQQLSDRGVRLLVGPDFAGLFLSAKPVIGQARVANCVPMMAADDLMNNAPFTFRAQEPNSARIPALLTYIQKSTPLKRIGLLTEDDSIGEDDDRQLGDVADNYGLQYVGSAFTGSVPDQRQLVQQMLQRGAEAVILSDSPATAARTLLAIKQLNAVAKLKTFGFSGLADYGLVQQAGDPANGLTFASGILDYLSDQPDAKWPPAYHAFATRALQQFGTLPNTPMMRAMPAAADCVAEWSKAVRAAGVFDGPRVARAWEKLDVPASQTVLGVREHFSATDHDAVGVDGLFVYQWVKSGPRWGLRQLAGPAF